MTTLEDRIAGVLIGHAAGDALGAPYEFQPPIKPEDAKMAPGGLGNWALGEWTDDTQQAILVAKHGAVPVAVSEALIDWYHGGPPDVGGTTAASLSAGLSAKFAGETPGQKFDALRFKAAEVNGYTNGSLMRTAPVALPWLGSPALAANAAAAVSKLTHAHPDAVHACMLWTVLVERMVREGGPLETGHLMAAIHEHLPKASWPFWLDVVDRAIHGDRDWEHLNNSKAAVALKQALSAIWHTPKQDTETALRRAVSYGGDTDTVAAIAGGLLGAMNGASSVPQAWQDVLHGWPGMEVHGLRELALATVPEGVLS